MTQIQFQRRIFDFGIGCVDYSLLFGYSTWHHTLQEPHFVVAHGGT